MIFLGTYLERRRPWQILLVQNHIFLGLSIWLQCFFAWMNAFRSVDFSWIRVTFPTALNMEVFPWKDCFAYWYPYACAFRHWHVLHRCNFLITPRPLKHLKKPLWTAPQQCQLSLGALTSRTPALPSILRAPPTSTVLLPGGLPPVLVIARIPCCRFILIPSLKPRKMRRHTCGPWALLISLRRPRAASSWWTPLGMTSIRLMPAPITSSRLLPATWAAQ